MNTLFKIFFAFLIITSNLFPQEDKQIEEKQTELYDLRSEISSLEDELSQKSQKEKESIEVLENYNKQAHLINKVINQLRREERDQQKEINKIEKDIRSIVEEINLLKDNYSKYVIALYKNGSYSELESIINSESFKQAVIRIEYLQRFSEKRKMDLEELKEKKQELAIAKNKLEVEKRKKTILVAEKKADEEKLTQKLNERRSVLLSIRKDKRELQKNITIKRQAQEQLKTIIAKLVEEAERKRREEELRRQQLLASKEGNIVNESDYLDETGFDYSLNTSGFSSFEELKGKMQWPLHPGKIVRGFGENRNSELNTVTVNYGVDISSKSDMSVRCVAEGIVSAIDWLPGYGSVIIISHKGDYRTVYSHLAEIYVDEGDKVKGGSVIAKIGESLDGKVLHFEIWNSRTNQDPEKWLVSK